MYDRVCTVYKYSRLPAGRMGIRAVVYYLATTFFAVILGIILVVTIKPGHKGTTTERQGQAKTQEALVALFDLIR